MIDDDKLEAIAKRVVPSTQVVNRVLIAGLTMTTILAGYAFAGKWKAEQRVQADEERLERVEAELAKVVQSNDPKLSSEGAALKRIDDRRKELTDLLPKSQ